MAAKPKTKPHNQAASQVERMTDRELAAFGIFPADPLEPREDRNSPPPPVRRTVADVDSDSLLAGFAPAPTRKFKAGWTAERQRTFIEALAESGCVSEACAAAGLSPRSAYKLRHRKGAESFSAAWANAETLAATRLTALAFERAVHGKSEYLFRDGILVAERRIPSDRLLMWLISHLDPVGYGRLANRACPPSTLDPRTYAARRLPQLLGELGDIAEEDSPTESADFAPVAENERSSRA